MAARRLIAILVVLMLISTFAAALAPRQRESTETTTTETTTSVAPTPAGAELIDAVVPARPQEPEVISGRRGDQLGLTVRVSAPAEVAIPELGLIAFATPGDPATFDLLLRERGSFPIEVREAERSGRVATIKVG